MPDTTLSATITEAYAVAPVAEGVILVALEIDHPTFVTPIRIVNDTADLVATLEADAPRDPGAEVTFIAFDFRVKPPEINTSGTPQLVIEIDNVTREILAYVETAMSSTELLTVIYRVFLTSDLSGPQNNPPLALTISAISADLMRVRAVAGYGDFVNRKFPNAEYSAEVFPGLIAQ